MKDFYFYDSKNLQSYLESGINEITSNELILFEFNKDLPPALIHKAITMANSRTKRFFVKLDLTVSRDPETIKKLADIGVKNICLKIPLEAIPTPGVAPAVLRFRHPLQRSKTVLDFFRIKYEFDNLINFSCEVVLNQENLHVLYPTIDYFVTDAKLSWLFLNPHELSFDNNTKTISDVLLQLRINRKTAMQVYFSPAHPHAENWNSRTDNLLSGPRFVDIDIANTCTHNCVFCGLYSDASIESFKKDGQGRLAPEILTKMAAKIDRDACLNFINSLPDAVQWVQFGGFG
ncbi:MAG: hypothetical protein ACXWQQ_14760, partial [Pseudobdellovibrio sp.]